MYYSMVLKEKPPGRGLTHSEIRDMMDSMEGEFYPIEIDSLQKTSSAMGFITDEFEETLDYNTDKLEEFIGEILADMEKESETGIYEYADHKIYLSR